MESDRWEATGLHEIFETTGTPVFAAKSYIGNLGSGGGVGELAASALALYHGVLPASLNYEQADPDCPVRVHTGAPRPVARPYAVKVGFTQMGQCAAVVIRKFSM